MVRPSAWAVFRLITSSNVVGCSMGRSAGLAPLRILSTYAAAQRKRSWALGRGTHLPRAEGGVFEKFVPVVVGDHDIHESLD
jgi:hypothetical protein